MARVGDCSWPSPGDCEGSCTFPGGEPKGNSSKVLVSLSVPHLWVGSCGVLVRTRFVLHLLATEPPSVGRHNGDVACRQAREPRKKIVCLHCHCSLDFSR